MTNHKAPARRRLDVPSAMLALVGLICGVIACALVAAEHVNGLILIPPIAAATIGLTHLFKREAPRR